jgi:hypothetical protein
VVAADTETNRSSILETGQGRGGGDFCARTKCQIFRSDAILPSTRLLQEAQAMP